MCIKCLKDGDSELSIMLMLSAPKLRSNPRNHTVPILDIFPNDQDPTVSYMVMPCLRSMDCPEFEMVREVVKFVDQILEVHSDIHGLSAWFNCWWDQGLVFQHKNGVAHR